MAVEEAASDEDDGRGHTPSIVAQMPVHSLVIFLALGTSAPDAIAILGLGPEPGRRAVRVA